MSRHEPTGAFTLIEVVVAVGVAVVLGTLILAISAETLKRWRRGQDIFMAEAGAKLAFDLLERDFHSAILRTERGGTWLMVDIRTGTGTLTQQNWNITGSLYKPAAAASLHLAALSDVESTIADDRFGVGSAWLRFVTVKDYTASEISAPSIVSYQVVRRPSSSSTASIAQEDKRYTLHRSIVRVTKSSGGSNGAFELGYDVSTSAYNSRGTSTPSSGDAESVFAPPLADAVISNVVDFGVWLYVRDTSGLGGLRRIFPTSSGSLTYRATASGEVPNVADVMLRILTEEGATLVQNIEGGRVTRPPQFASDDEWWWAVAVEHSRVFVRRIWLNADPGP